MNENFERLKTLFPRASKDFFDANVGLRPKTDKPVTRSPLVGAAHREEKSDVRVVLRYVISRVRLLDPDALDQSTKTLTDCLCAIGLLPGDSAKDIELEVTQEKVNHYKDQKTILHIQYP